MQNGELSSLHRLHTVQSQPSRPGRGSTKERGTTQLAPILMSEGDAWIGGGCVLAP